MYVCFCFGVYPTLLIKYIITLYKISNLDNISTGSVGILNLTFLPLAMPLRICKVD